MPHRDIPGSSRILPYALLWVNYLWASSFIVSLASGLYLMTVQHWCRQSAHQGGVRMSFLLRHQKYHMAHATSLVLLPLHISVFLFLAGHIIFLRIGSVTLSNIFATFTALCLLGYSVLTILPTVDNTCPYSTPLSSTWWYLWHGITYCVSLGLFWLLHLVYHRIAQETLGDRMSIRDKLIQWEDTLSLGIKKHKQHLKAGLQGGIIQSIRDASVPENARELLPLLQLPHMAEKRNIETFLASLSPATLIQLMQDGQDSQMVTLGDHIYSLLESCSTNTIGLDETVRRRRLLVCLNVLNDMAKYPLILGDLDVLNNLRIDLANICRMQPLWHDKDPSIRILACSICSLLARQVHRTTFPH